MKINKNRELCLSTKDSIKKNTSENQGYKVIFHFLVKDKTYNRKKIPTSKENKKKQSLISDKKQNTVRQIHKCRLCNDYILLFRIFFLAFLPQLKNFFF